MQTICLNGFMCACCEPACLKKLLFRCLSHDNNQSMSRTYNYVIKLGYPDNYKEVFKETVTLLR